MAPHPDLERIQRALAGHGPAIAELVKRLSPVVHRRVAAVLLRCGGRSRDLRPEIEDLIQEVLLSLFVREGRALDAWNPEYGVSLEGFVGVIARRRAVSTLRTRRSSPLTQQPTDPADIDLQPDSSRSGAAIRSTEARDSLERLAQGLQERLSPLGLQMFQLLFVAEEEVSDVARKTGLSADSVYQWRARIKKLALEIQGELARETAPEYRSVAND